MIIVTGPRHLDILPRQPKGICGQVERPTSNVEWENMEKQSLKPELLDYILEETEELINA